MNMSATCLVVPDDNAEVKQVIGETQQITRQVATRTEDLTFAKNLGRVLLKNVSCLAEQQALPLTGDGFHAHDRCCWTSVPANFLVY